MLHFCNIEYGLLYVYLFKNKYIIHLWTRKQYLSLLKILKS